MLREQESSSQFRMCQETEAKVDLLPQVSKLSTSAKHQITSAPWIHLIHHPHFVLRTSITIGTWVLILSAAPSIRRSRKVVTGPPVFSKLPTSEELSPSFCAISRYQPLSADQVKWSAVSCLPGLPHLYRISLRFLAPFSRLRHSRTSCWCGVAIDPDMSSSQNFLKWTFLTFPIEMIWFFFDMVTWL